MTNAEIKSTIYNSQDFHWPVRIYWEDTDAGGIVFYANYLKYFERARTEWLRQLGFYQEKIRAEYGGMFVVTAAQLQYRAPARLDDMLHISAKVLQVRRTQLTLTQTAWKIPQENQNGHQVATSAQNAVSAARAFVPEALCGAQISLAWVDAATMRPAKMPAALLEVLGQNNLQ